MKEKYFNTSLTTRVWLNEAIVNVIITMYFVLLLYAAFSKLADYEKSLLQLSKSPITSTYANLLAWFIPSLEILIAILLMLPRTASIALHAALALMSSFTAYIYAILNFSSTIPCSCGGILERLSWKEHFLFNIIFIVLAITAILLKKDSKQNTQTKPSVKTHLLANE